MWVELQWRTVAGLPLAALFALAFHRFSSRWKKQTEMAVFGQITIPFAYWMYCKYRTAQSKLFELSFPPHPTIINLRRKCINQCCFVAPSMLKNEIEFMHANIEGVSIDDEETQVQEGKFRYEKTFTIG
jgi:hypothetical protein